MVTALPDCGLAGGDGDVLHLQVGVVGDTEVTVVLAALFASASMPDRYSKTLLLLSVVMVICSTPTPRAPFGRT